MEVGEVSDRPERYLLLDSSVVVPYYLPEASRNRRVPGRIRTLLDAVRRDPSGRIFLYMPNICICEAFDTFNKLYWARWNPEVKRVYPRALDARVYRRARTQFQADIHDGRLMHQYELDRYHVLAADLISLVDHYYQHYHERGKKQRKNPMGTRDILVAAMATCLARVHGRERLALVTAEKRMSDLLVKVAPRVTPSTAAKLGLPAMVAKLGFRCGADMYPQVMDLARARQSDLAAFFGEWPPAT
jgi:hypothetical protein